MPVNSALTMMGRTMGAFPNSCSHWSDRSSAETQRLIDSTDRRLVTLSLFVDGLRISVSAMFGWILSLASQLLTLHHETSDCDAALATVVDPSLPLMRRVSAPFALRRVAMAGFSTPEFTMMSNAQADRSPAQPPSRLLWLMAGVLGASSLAAGATWLARSTDGLSASVPTASAPVAVAASATRPVNPSQEAVVSATTGSPRPGGSKAAAPGSTTHPAPAPSTPAATIRSTSVCTDCGVVESVRAYTVKGEGSGVGAVAGGVLGAAVGNQMGKGDGRKAMTVLGALGGGLAGHEVEKRTKAETLHEVTVRMDDGNLRTVSQSVAPRIGVRVRLEGKGLKELG